MYFKIFTISVMVTMLNIIITLHIASIKKYELCNQKISIVAKILIKQKLSQLDSMKLTQKQKQKVKGLKNGRSFKKFIK